MDCLTAASSTRPPTTRRAAGGVRAFSSLSLLLQERHAFGHPLRRRRSLEIVIEELEVTNRQVLAVGHAPQAMAFAGIRQHDGALVVVTERVVEVHAFAEGYGRVGRAVHDQEGRRRVLRMR